VAEKDALSSYYELGKLHCERGDYNKAIEYLVDAAFGFSKASRLEEYLETANLLMRIYAERGEQDKIQILKEDIQDLVIKEGISLTAKTFYTLGLCASYKGQYDVALDYLQKSLSDALAKDQKKDVCYAINGIAIVYYRMGRYTEALKEIYNLQVFFQVLDLPDLEMSVKFLNGHILRALQKHEQALEIFWQCYDQLKLTKNLTHYNHLLVALARTYCEMGDKNLSKMYLRLAEKSIDPQNMSGLVKEIEKISSLLGEPADQEIDLRFSMGSNVVTEKKLGKINFKNQFILLDMLRLFLTNPGSVYSKEDLVRLVWKQDYDPSIHDNKIYVTIKRLRKMIEPDYEKPKYIFRAKNGYYLNKTARVAIEQ
jgi:tetratricopeptide (TPR) repeat protein